MSASLIVFRKEGHDEVEHGFALGGLGLGDEDGKRDQCVVGESLVSVFGQQRPFLLRKCRKSAAPMRLLPSAKEWFLTMK